MKNSIKREKSQACLSYSERENVRATLKATRQKFNFILTLALWLTMVQTAWAEKQMTDPGITATVPNQTMSAYSTVYDSERTYVYIYNKFDEANSPTSFGVSVGEIVKDGETTLTLGTHYMFGNVYYSDMTGMNEPANEGDECLVEIIGMGDYAGTRYVPFIIISPSADGTHGDLSWSLAGGTLSITGTGAMTAAATSAYPWYNYCSSITTICIGEGITSIADNAFGSISNMYTYSNVTKVHIPSTVTSIGADAFKGCISVTDVYCCADPTNLTWGDTEDDFMSDHATTCHVADGTDWSRFSNVNVQFKGDLAYFSIPYIDANGHTKYCTNYTVLKTDELPSGCGGWDNLPGGWYVVENWNPEYGDYDGADFVREESVTFKGDAHLILCDGAKMRVSVGTGTAVQSDKTLTVYGQSSGSGTLVSNTSTDGFGLQADYGLTINGGTVNVEGAYAIYGNNVSILGGKVTANGTVGCGTITLGWRNATDCITATAYECTTLKIADDQYLYNGSDLLSGTVSDMTLLNNKSLQPAIPYIDASGNTAYCTDYTVLTGSDVDEIFEITQEDECGWYVVTGKVSYSAGLFIEGYNNVVNLILCDDAELSLSGGDYAFHVSGYHFNIYGQTNGTGKVVTTNSEYGIYASVCFGDGYSPTLPGSFTIYGGTIEATGEYNGIYVYGGAFTINGGVIEATGEHGFSTDGDLTINNGSITATGDYNGIYAYKCNVTINGGSVIATATEKDPLNDDKESIGIIVEGEEGNTNIGSITINGGTVKTTGKDIGIYAGSTITISGGNVKATGGSCGIRNHEGCITISGGSVTADVVEYGNGISLDDGDVYLGWVNASDRIYVSSFNLGGKIYIADGQSFYNGSEVIHSGKVNDRSNLEGKTLVPSVITLAAKQVTVDEQTDYWTTFYSGDAGYGIDAEENACAYTATVSGGTITLHKLGKVIPKGTAVIIVGEDASISMTATSATVADMPLNDLHGVDVATLLDDVKSTYSADAILMLSNKGGKFGFHELATTMTNVPARKAFLAIDDPDPNTDVRQFMMVFDDATGIHSIDNGQLIMDNEAGAWYSLDGRRLSGKPTQKGLYIHNGTKVLVK